MKRTAKQILSGTMLLSLALPLSAMADEQALQLKVDELEKKVEKLEDKSLSKWLTIGGDYRFRVDSLKGDMPAHSSAIGSLMNLVGNFTAPAPVGVAGQTIGGITSPSATQFIMQGKAGSLFTSSQFNTIINQYMPQAMFATFTSPTFGAQIGSLLTTSGNIDNAIAATKLTPQQQAILATLNARVMPTVVGMFGGPTAMNTALGGMMASLGVTDPAKFQQLLNQMLVQGFLGAGSGNLAKVPAYKPSNDLLYSNRFGLDLHAKATKDVTVNVRLLAYKGFGMDEGAATGSDGTPFFADRVGVFDGTLGHVPSNDYLAVDRAYATWANIAELPVWFSVGRRPATGGVPSHLRQNNPTPGNGGTPALLVDYAFDGMTLGWAPDIDMLPGFYSKLCYGRAFEGGVDSPGAKGLGDTDMVGIAVIPYDTDPLRISMQWNRGVNIFDFPMMQNTAFGDTGVSVELGSMDWFELGALSTLKNIGPGSVNLFGTIGMSQTHPNNNVSNNAGFQGLMTGQFFAEEAPSDKTGYAGYFGARYDFNPSKTKVGLEYNHGTKNWIPFVPSADDIWTSKVGTRGNVYEGYLIQELNLKPISSHLSKAFFRLGYQYYDFEYTGSNNWVGAPQKISDIKSTDLFMLTPLKTAQNIYATFEVKF